MIRPSGFSLLELMMAIAVGGVLLALGIPTYREVTLNNQRASRVNEFVADLTHARAQAVAYRRAVTMCRTNNPSAATPTCGAGNGWEEGWVVFIDSDTDATVETSDLDLDGNGIAEFDRDGNGTVNVADAILRRHESLIPVADHSAANSQKFRLRGNNNVVNRVTFDAAGLANTNGTLVACDSRNLFRKGRAIVVAVGGRIQSLGLDPRDPRVPDGVTTCP